MSTIRQSAFTPHGAVGVGQYCKNIVIYMEYNADDNSICSSGDARFCVSTFRTEAGDGGRGCLHDVSRCHSGVVRFASDEPHDLWQDFRSGRGLHEPVDADLDSVLLNLPYLHLGKIIIHQFEIHVTVLMHTAEDEAFLV